MAGNDNSQYILKYKIARAKNASLNEQIRILEEYKEKEFTERWSYEPVSYTHLDVYKRQGMTMFMVFMEFAIALA